MSDLPERCPNARCARHADPSSGSCIRYGFFAAARHAARQQRFLCKACGRTFSLQTFRHDYREQRPELNVRIMEMVISGTGFRQIGRILGLSLNGVRHKHVKIARTCQGLHDNVLRQLPPDRSFLLDEEETYEQASIRPLTVPILIEQRTWFVVATEVGRIRRLAKPGTARRLRQDEEEARFGQRPDESNECVDRILRRLAELAPGTVTLLSDEKTSYGSIGRAVFGERLTHLTTPGSAPRTIDNPLFPINTTIAMTRDNNGRLRRKSWLVTKRRQFLQLQLHIFTVYRNYIRYRFNHDRPDETPAVLLGLLTRALSFAEVLEWRQDLGPNPLVARSCPAPVAAGGGQ